MATSVTNRSTASSPRSTDVSLTEVKDRLAALQALQMRRSWIRRCTWAIAAAWTTWFCIAWADWMWELAWSWRAVGCAAVLAIGIGVFLRRKEVASRTTQRSLLGTARHVEDRLHYFGQRLRTTLDYQDAEAHPAVAHPHLLMAVQRETSSLAATTDWDHLKRSRSTFVCSMILLSMGCVWLACAVAVPEYRIATGRMLLLPWHYSMVRFDPHSQIVRAGETATIRVDIQGRPIDSAQIRYVHPSQPGEWKETGLRPVEASSSDSEKDSRAAAQAEKKTDTQDEQESDAPVSYLGSFVANLPALTEDVEFEVVAGPVELPRGSITVLQPLQLVSMKAEITPPEYTGLPKEAVDLTANGELKVQEGATIDLVATLSRATMEVQWSDSLHDQADANAAKNATSSSTVTKSSTTLQPEGKRVAIRLVDVRRSGDGRLTASTADGVTLDPVEIHFRVQIDEKPKVRFLEPPEKLTVIPTADVPMHIEARDDLGLLKTGIAYQVGSGSLQTLVERDAEGETSLDCEAVLYLEELSLSHQDAVTYYAFAEDNYFNERRRVTTELRFIDIRPFKLAFQQLDSGGT